MHPTPLKEITITINRKRFKEQLWRILQPGQLVDDTEKGYSSGGGSDKICFHNFFFKTQFHKHNYQGFWEHTLFDNTAIVYESHFHSYTSHSSLGNSMIHLIVNLTELPENIQHLPNDLPTGFLA
jgi:hypothetical protein